MTPEEYIKDISHAVDHLFDGLGYYNKLLTSKRAPVFSIAVHKHDEAEIERQYDAWLVKNRKKIEDYNTEIEKYFGYSTSKGVLCGALLQIAFTGLNRLSPQLVTMPPSCTHIFEGNENSRNKIFCVGRNVFGLPMGLVIYAARNQYAHMEDKGFNPIVTRVFEHLTQYGTKGKYRNPQFDLSSRSREIYADNVVAIFEWKSTEAFIKDMKVMLGCT